MFSGMERQVTEWSLSGVDEYGNVRAYLLNLQSMITPRVYTGPSQGCPSIPATVLLWPFNFRGANVEVLFRKADGEAKPSPRFRAGCTTGRKMKMK